MMNFYEGSPENSRSAALRTYDSCGASDTASDDQLTQIQEKGVIVIGTEGTYAPNSYHDEEGNLTGFDVEVGRLIARELGVEAQFVESSWDSLFAAMDSGRKKCSTAEMTCLMLL